MEFKAKSFHLKNGIQCILRSPRAEDAENMNEYIKTIAGETNFILRYPEECVESKEQEAAFLESFLISPHHLMLSAFINGEVVGNSQVVFNPRLKTKHRASFAIGIKKEYWNIGLGSVLLNELLDIAKQHGVLQGELEFIEGNTRAQALYEKMGFKMIGEREKAIRYKDGTFLSEFFMVNDLTFWNRQL